MKVPEHIRGDGPDRKLLPNYRKLGEVDDYGSFLLLQEIITHTLKTNIDRNDIDDPGTYRLAQDCPLKTYFPSTYRQILCQHHRPVVSPCNPPEQQEAEREELRKDPTEFDYKAYIVQPISASVGKLLYDAIGVHFRARLAILPPGEVLDWHIDSNTSYSCRIQIPIFGSSHWQVKRRKEIESKELKPGEIWFTNTGFPHRVENKGDEDRVTLIVGCKFDAIKDRFPEVVSGT